jgi:Peptidase family M1 domain
MLPLTCRTVGWVTVLVALSLPLCAADAPVQGRNSDPAYQQLRTLTLGGENVGVSNLTLHRDAATFHLRSGAICFVAPVSGKVTGAVFVGDGNLILDPRLPSEIASLKMLTRESEFSENFSQAVFRFTDSTYDEIKKAGGAGSAACDAGLLHDSQSTMRHNQILKWNLEARLLQDLLSTEPGGFFLAFIHGKKYSGKEIFAIDPHGAPPLVMPVDPEEVEFATYDDNKLGVWAAFHFADEYKKGTALGSQANGVIHIEHQQLETTIEKNANLTGKSTTTFVSRVNGLRVVPFDLYRRLRVQSVTAEGGQSLSFVQEDKNDDADFSVILPKTLAAGEKFTITTSYSGKEAVSNEGNGNYFPIARHNWYPNNASSSLGEYTAYDMTFRIPKGMKITATGSLVSDTNEGGQDVTVWKSEVPQTVAGFNFGRFKVEEAKLTAPDYVVRSYANEEPPDWVRSLQHEVDADLPTQGSHMGAPVALGNMNTTGMIKHALAEGQVSVQLYSDYFGALPYKHLAMSQQTACDFGQAWPTLVWLPICSFFDTTVRHSLGLDFGDRGYWKIVAPHEVAHQWWGHLVGFNSYRDQWMSEGFADMSASLFIQLIEKNPKKFTQFWNDERELLTLRNKEGFRAIDVGPLTMGYRLNNSRGGFNVTRDLIYPKGAYILHMVRMMMWDRQTGDQNFKATMQDFVKTYSGKAATTEDFKAMVEKHMTKEMDLDGNHRMDWFFNEYVYGTALPSYKMDATFDKDANGDVVFAFKLTQSGVDDKFRMLVPIYLELADGRTVNVGRASLIGNSSIDQKVPLRGVKTAPKRALVNYNYDVLASN